MEEIIYETIEEMEAEYKALGEKIKKQKQAEAAKKQARLESEKEQRKKIIEDKEKELSGLIRDYIRDYGCYCSTKYPDKNEDVFSYLYHLFF